MTCKHYRGGKVGYSKDKAAPDGPASLEVVLNLFHLY